MKSVKKQNLSAAITFFVYCAINYAGEMLINKYYDSSRAGRKKNEYYIQELRNISMRKYQF